MSNQNINYIYRLKYCYTQLLGSLIVKNKKVNQETLDYFQHYLNETMPKDENEMLIKNIVFRMFMTNKVAFLNCTYNDPYLILLADVRTIVLHFKVNYTIYIKYVKETNKYIVLENTFNKQNQENQSDQETTKFKTEKYKNNTFVKNKENKETKENNENDNQFKEPKNKSKYDKKNQLSKKPNQKYIKKKYTFQELVNIINNSELMKKFKEEANSSKEEVNNSKEETNNLKKEEDQLQFNENDRTKEWGDDESV